MFTRENTKQIKGIAILLMLMHHLYAFTDRIPYDMSVTTNIIIYGKKITEIMGIFGGVCVPLYMFLGGYGLYMKVGKLDSQQLGSNSLVGHYANLYKAYWKVFLIFIPIAYAFFNNQSQYCEDVSICNRFAIRETQVILVNFLGVSDSLVSEWWFFFSYLLALFLGFVYLELFKNNRKPYLEVATVVIWFMLVNDVFTMLPWSAGYEGLEANVWFNKILMNGQHSVFFLIGIIFAKYQIFDAWKTLIRNLNRIEKIVLTAFVIFLVVDAYVFLLVQAYSIILVPVFVFVCSVFIEETKILRTPLKILGEHSTNMWLIHGFFCYYFHPFVKLVYGSKNAIVALLVLVSLSLGASILTNKIWKLIGTLYGKLRSKMYKEVSTQ